MKASTSPAATWRWPTVAAHTLPACTDAPLPPVPMPTCLHTCPSLPYSFQSWSPLDSSVTWRTHLLIYICSFIKDQMLYKHLWKLDSLFLLLLLSAFRSELWIQFCCSFCLFWILLFFFLLWCQGWSLVHTRQVLHHWTMSPAQFSGLLMNFIHIQWINFHIPRQCI